MELVLTDSVEVPEPVIEVGVNVPVAPAGSPAKLSPTVPVNPFKAVTVAV